MNVTGIILAGGKSSRMGQDKGLTLLNGKPLVKYVIDALESITQKIIIISNNDTYKRFGFPVYNDVVKEKGPVGGIYTALTHSITENNVIVSCDTPFVTPNLLLNLIEESHSHEVTFYQYKNKTHPLVGVYKKSVLPVFKSSLDKNQLKLMLVNQSLNCNIVKVEDKFDGDKLFFNINTLQDLENAQNKV